MNKKIGFIGCGNMGSAMVQGLIKSGNFKKKDIYCSAKSKESKERLKSSLGINVLDNIELAKTADILILAVKPHFFSDVINEIENYVKEDAIIVSIAAGVEIIDIENWFKKDNLKVVRTMPNTPALVGEGMSAICTNKNISQEELEEVKIIFNSFGKCEILNEEDFHAFIAICGSSPAYVYMMIEAMGTAGISSGIQSSKAYRLAAQSVLGTAKMVLETGEHPAVLRDRVCSPKGTTIDAVAKLESAGFRSSIISAMKVCEDKSKMMQSNK